jgi:DNA polymerase III subunit delta
MILKPYEIKNQIEKENIFLFYGENPGQKEEIISSLFKKKNKDATYNYTEKEIINNLENFYNQITSKSFFEDRKLIIINHITEKFKEEVEVILEKKINDITFILIADILDTKSKIRKFFEKDKDLVIVPFYKDDTKSLSDIARSFFKEKKITTSQETVNIIVERSAGSRKNIKNELEKIENFLGLDKSLTSDQVLKITNLSENHSINELINNCLAKNKKITLKIMNENIFSFEDSIIITRTLLNFSKRLLKLLEKKEENINLEQLISSHRPPIFWKDKEIIKTQIMNWTSFKIRNIIFKTSNVELQLKKNSLNALNIIFDFLIELCSATNNSS